MTRPVVPKFAASADWPRKASDAIGYAQNDITALEGRAASLETATDWSALADYADDTAAASGGVPVGSIYRTGSVVKVRVA